MVIFDVAIFDVFFFDVAILRENTLNIILSPFYLHLVGKFLHQ